MQRSPYLGEAMGIHLAAHLGSEPEMAAAIAVQSTELLCFPVPYFARHSAGQSHGVIGARSAFQQSSDPSHQVTSMEPCIFPMHASAFGIVALCRLLATDCANALARGLDRRVIECSVKSGVGRVAKSRW